MPTEEKTVTQELPPATAVVITGTGDGGVGLQDKTLAITKGIEEPNIVVRVVTPVMAILIRAINMFCTTLLSILTAALGTEVIQANDFGHLVLKCAGLAVAATGLDLLRNVITLFGKLERDYPLLRV